MGADVNINDSPPPLDLLQNGWANVAEGFPDAKAPTYATNKDWDRRAPGSGATRIDYILVNAAGRHLVKDFALMRSLPAKQHLGLQDTIDLDLCTQEARGLQRPVPYPSPPDSYPWEVQQAPGGIVHGQFAARMGQANKPMMSMPCSPW